MINLKIKELDGRVIRDTKRKKASFIYENTQLHLTLLKEKKSFETQLFASATEN